MAASVVQRRAKGSSGSVASLTIDAADGWAAPTAGNIIVVFGNSDATMTASGYTQIQSVIDGNGAYCWVKVATGSETSVTVAPGSTARTNMVAWEIAGVGLPVDDVDNTLITGSGGLTTNAVAIDTTGPGIIIAAALLHGYSVTDPTSPSWSNSFTQQSACSSTPLASSSDVTTFVADRVTTAAGSYSTVCTWTTSQAVDRQHIIAAFKESAAATNAPADVGSGTGTAGGDAAAVAANAGVNAAGAGSAPTAVARVAPNGALASGSNTPAQIAPTAAVSPNATEATGSGSAPDATVSTGTTVNAPATEATGAGTADQPVVALVALPSESAGSGTAPDATVSTSSSATAPAELVAGSGAALDAGAAVAASAAESVGSGVAPDATVSSASSASAPADPALGAGAAPDASVATSAVDLTGPAGSGAALDPSTAVFVAAAEALGTGSAPAATADAAYPVFPAAAAGSGSAPDAAVLVMVLPGAAIGEGVAPQPSVTAASEVVPFLDVDTVAAWSSADSSTLTVSGEPDSRPIIAGIPS